MSKKLQRSNRETKKPKQDKAKPSPVAATSFGLNTDKIQPKTAGKKK